MTQVEKGVLDIFSNEEIKLDRETVDILSNRRHNAAKSMFENGSELLMSNPSLLFLICTSIFRSPDVFCPKSRVEVYNYAVQSALRSWTSQEPTISEDLLTSFLIDLSTYLHLESPSGLIDTYDMKQLCYLTLRRQSCVNDRTKLLEHGNTMIFTLESNIGIIAEIGLEVFSFLHLSFQEYFVSQSLVKDSSVDEVANRILTFIINPRFRESLLLTLGWISWKWTLDDYDKLCNLLITPNKNYAIPLGTLLFFDALIDLQTLPSNSIIYSALNSLLDHHFNSIAERYLIQNLSKLDENIITEWMQLYLKDDKRLSKFCRCLVMKDDLSLRRIRMGLKPIPLVIYEEMWSFHKINTSAEFIIDQTMRVLMTSEGAHDNIFRNELFSYFSLENICLSTIHPLILSVIVAVCGGMSFKRKEKSMTLYFSSKEMHRQSSIIQPIIEYLADNKESHTSKVQILIEQYKNVLRNASQSDTSIDIVDTFIALICLKGVSQTVIYEMYDGYKALSLALKRLKLTWFYLNKSCANLSLSYIERAEKSLITSEIETILCEFYSQSDQSKVELVRYSLSCAAAWNRLGINIPQDWLEFNIFRQNEVHRYLACQPEFNYLTEPTNPFPMKIDINSVEIFQNELFFILSFLPQSLQPLYYCTIISPSNKIDFFPIITLLSQCLVHLEDVSKYDLKFPRTVSRLQSLFTEHMLENYVSVLFWEKKLDKSFANYTRDGFWEAMEYEKLIDQPTNLEKLINIEHQRVCEAKKMEQNKEKDWRLFAAIISLARLFQARYRIRECRPADEFIISTVESEEMQYAIINIFDPVLRIIALSIILAMKDPLIFDEEQSDKLRWEMIILLKYLLPRLPLLTSTLLFVRCYTACQVFSVPLKYMADVIGEKLNKTLLETESEHHEASFIALQQLDNSDLSEYLSKFSKRRNNLSDLLNFDSTIFFQYFINTTSFGSSNNALLSSMYLTELAFDPQILKMYTGNDHKGKISFLNELKQLWNYSSKTEKIMTFEVAASITNYLKMSNKKELDQVIRDVSDCLMIEKKALSVMKEWLDYRMDKNLHFFSYYGALQMISEGLDVPDSIIIINEIVDSSSRFCLTFVIERLFTSKLVNLTVAHQILVTLHRNAHYYSEICLFISSKEILELILNLELERITSNICDSSKMVTKSFLSLFNGYSKDLQFYLTDYLSRVGNELITTRNIINEGYLAVLVKWIIDNSRDHETQINLSTELYKYIFTLLHDRRLPRIQKSILSALNSVFIYRGTRRNHVFMQDDAIDQLAKIICSYDTYSEDVLAICLLTCGNYLFNSQQCPMRRLVSDEIENVLTILFETPLTEIVSIRAAVCLTFVQHRNVEFHTIWNWFRNKPNLTSKTTYNILLQLTLYKISGVLFDPHLDKIVDLLDIFIDELYNYLCNKDNNDYLAEPIPDYLYVALKISERNFGAFHRSIQTSSVSEEKFKRAICFYFYQRSKPSDYEKLIMLYAMFGILTVDLIKMMESIDDYWDKKIPYYLKIIRQVSDRDVIEKIFQLLDFKASQFQLKGFSNILELIVQLAQAHAVSLLEVHHRASFIFNNWLYKGDIIDWSSEKCIFRFLIDLSCIQSEHFSESKDLRLTVSDIDREFERVIQNVEKKSALFLRRNYFLNIFQSLSRNSDKEDDSILLSNSLTST